MAKSELRLQAREMRSRGDSVKTISKKLGVARSTLSRWVSDIILSVEQLEKLKQNSIRGSELGRLKGSLVQKQKRLEKVENYIQQGCQQFAELNISELLIAGLSLYWAEGSKKKRRIEFCNSDPRMVKLMARWLDLCFGVKKEELICWIGINEAHLDREQAVKNYWSGIVGVPTERFRKTSYKRVKNVKVYENHNDHFGTFYFSVSKSADLSYKVMGLIEGLIKAA